jgi:tRNA/rRNA methyltransferase
MPSSSVYSVYIVRCSDGALYIGHAENIDERLARHNRGEATSFTAHRRPVSLVYSEGFSARKAAVARERQLKRWTHAKKEALIAGDLALLKRL